MTTPSAKALSTIGILINPRGNVEQRVPCPHCARSGRDDALGANIDTGVFHCFRCGWRGRAVDSRWQGSGHASYQAPRVARIDDPATALRKRERLRQTWKDTVSLTHSRAHAVRSYLESRALGDVLKKPPAVLRAHAGLIYWDGTINLGTYPAMIALVHGADGQPITLHVTYLRADGCSKAIVPSPRKILGVPVQGATRGGAIRLYEPRAGLIGIAEGIESALSLHFLQQIPTWGTLCADNLARVHLPRSLRELYIGVDVDQSGKGEKVAYKLAARVKRCDRRIKVCIVMPEVHGFGDLNDELRKRVTI